MNVHEDFWKDLIGDRDLWTTEDNIDIGTLILRRIIDRLEDPTVAKVATIYNSLGRETVREFGVDVAYYYSQRIWEQGHTVEDVLPHVP